MRVVTRPTIAEVAGAPRLSTSIAAALPAPLSLADVGASARAARAEPLPPIAPKAAPLLGAPRGPRAPLTRRAGADLNRGTRSKRIRPPRVTGPRTQLPCPRPRAPPRVRCVAVGAVTMPRLGEAPPTPLDPPRDGQAAATRRGMPVPRQVGGPDTAAPPVRRLPTRPPVGVGAGAAAGTDARVGVRVGATLERPPRVVPTRTEKLPSRAGIRDADVGGSAPAMAAYVGGGALLHLAGALVALLLGAAAPPQDAVLHRARLPSNVAVAGAPDAAAGWGGLRPV